MDTLLEDDNADIGIQEHCSRYITLLSEYENAKANLTSESNPQNYFSAMKLLAQMSTILLLIQRRLSLGIQNYEENIIEIDRKIQNKRPSEPDSSKAPKKPPSKCKLFSKDNENASFYFRTNSHYCKVNNREYASILRSGHKSVNPFQYSSRWTSKQKRLLYDGVHNYLMRKRFSSYLSKLQQIYEDIVTTTSEDTLHALHRKNNEIVNEWEMVKKKPLAELIQEDANFEDYEWKTISQKIRKYHSPEECKRMWHLVASLSLNHQPWFAHEDLHLQCLAIANEFENWNEISAKMDTNRSEFMCFVRFQNHLRKRIHRSSRRRNEIIAKELRNGQPALTARDVDKGKFSNRENYMIAYYRKKGYSYHFIACKLGKRTAKQIYDRCKTMNRLRSFKRKWTGREIRLLLRAVKYHGEKWLEVSKYVMSKDAKQCKRKFHFLNSRDRNLVQMYLTRDPSLKEINALLKSSRKNRNSHPVDEKLEMYFLELLQKSTPNASFDREAVIRNVILLLKELNFKVKSANTFLSAISDWLFESERKDSSEREFDFLFRNFSNTTKKVSYVNNAKFCSFVPSCYVALPPNKCSIYGLHSLKKNYEQYCESKNVNFQQIWSNINEKRSKDKDFVSAKIMWYQALRMLFYWPIKLETISPEYVID